MPGLVVCAWAGGAAARLPGHKYLKGEGLFAPLNYSSIVFFFEPACNDAQHCISSPRASRVFCSLC